MRVSLRVMIRRLAASRPAPWLAVLSVRAPVRLIPGVGILEGAVVGAVVGGVAGAIWADQDRDGRVDGYVVEGQYYPGAPPAQPPRRMRPRRVAASAAKRHLR